MSEPRPRTTLTTNDSESDISIESTGAASLTVGQRFNIRGEPHDWVCPTCGYQEGVWQGEFGPVVGLTISIQPYSGYYCMRCWAQWLAEHLPKLVKRPQSQGTVETPPQENE